MNPTRTVREALGRLGIGGRVGALLMGVFLVLAVVGPALAPYGPSAEDPGSFLAGPSRTHLLGTDESGCDVLSMLLYGARHAALVAGAVVSLSLLIGLGAGACAGFYGGLADEVLMRIVDVVLAFPGLLLNIAIVALVRHPGTSDVIFALVANGWVGYARVARGQVLELRERAFVEAARALGLRPLRVLARHVVPNVLSPLLVQASFGFAGVILVEASLAFLGVGRLVPYAWGALLDQGRTYLFRTSHLALAPGACIAAVVLGGNLLGDGLRDQLDPRRR